MKSKGPFKLVSSPVWGYEIRSSDDVRICQISKKLIDGSGRQQNPIRNEEDRKEEAEFVLKAMNELWKITGPIGEKEINFPTKCMDCKKELLTEDDVCVTCSHTEPYLELCQSCYNKRGNSVR